VRVYRDYLRGLAQRKIGVDLKAKGDPSDLVQETFLQVFREPQRFDGLSGNELKAVLSRILLNNLRSFARQFRSSQKRGIGREVSMDRFREDNGFPLEITEPSATPGASVEDREDLQRLMAGLERLPERQRLLLTWRSLEGRTFREIGEDLGCSAVGARKAWLKALGTLRRELGACPG
jgi:RNA polymerase sigma-70 factor (ECF subfamily)